MSCRSVTGGLRFALPVPGRTHRRKGAGGGRARRRATLSMVAKPKEDLQKAHRRRKNRESLLETLESIIVAFVLAFIFRAFVVEAFVIPTGSMGPTLYGRHAELECTDCGFQFSIGAESGRRGGPAPRRPGPGELLPHPVQRGAQ